MELNQKINFNRYAILTGLNCIIGAIFSRELWIYLTIVVIFSAANQILLMKVLQIVLSNNGKSKNPAMLFLFFILKTLLLGVAFYLLVRNAKDYVILGVVLYIFQLIILILSTKNIASLFIKKGPTL